MALARSLAKWPKLLLLDRPVGALDKRLRLQMRLELAEIIERVGMTYVVVAHDQEGVTTTARHIAIIYLGCTEQTGNPMDICETPVSRLVCGFIGNTNLFDGVLVGGVQDHTVIICPQLESPIYVGHGTSTHAEDERATCALQPKRVMISAQKPGNLEYARHGWAQGIVYDIAYLGDHLVYHVKLAPGMTVQTFMTDTERRIARPT